MNDGFDPDGCWSVLPELRARREREMEAAAESPELGAFLNSEFTSIAGLARGPNRRRMLQLMGASFALGGLAGCGSHQNRENTQSRLVPYVHQPPRIIPSASLSYASTLTLDGIANGIAVITRDGRPIKVEGNAQHPWTRGGTDIFMQASILGLYDPDRSQVVRHFGKPTAWIDIEGVILSQRQPWRKAGGRLRLLTGPVSSPSMLAMIQAMKRAYPGMHWHVHSPVEREAAYQGAARAFGKPVETRWRFDRADVVVSLGGDFLDPGPQQVGVSRDWVEARRKAEASGRLLTLYSAAATPNLTTAKADHHLVARDAEIAQLAEWLMADVIGTPPQPQGDPLSRFRAEAGAALRAAKGRGIVLTGAHQPPALHEAVQRLNAALGNTGGPVFHTAPVLPQGSQGPESFASLLQAMGAGGVSALVMLDVNPVYASGQGEAFIAALKRVPLKIHAGEYVDETAVRSDWHLPLAHPLESWGDARAWDGTVSLMQPMVEPLYEGRTGPEILSLLSDPKARGGLQILREYWQGQWKAGGAAFEAKWERALIAGFVPNTALPAETVTASAGAAKPAVLAPSGGLDLLIRPDPSLYDGRFANIGWLQELPKPLTKVVWDNFIAISPELAKRESIGNGDIVELRAGGRMISGPAWALAGQQAETVTAYLGYGRQVAGAVAERVGYDAYPIRDPATPWRIVNVSLARTKRQRQLATTQELYTMEGHDFAKARTVSAPPIESGKQPQAFYKPWPETGYAWGMVIDIDSCIGCNACVVACQAENNVPIVGRDQVLLGRDMHWLRVDRYSKGETENPDTRFMPVPCMQCELAPCEVGCPVNATVHDHDGLNVMVYNRCIGTRTCEAYCPYKVRRFNFTDYALKAPPSAQAQYNPEVTVRGRGVMEKCTYCVQRIERAHIVADRENRKIHDGEVRTACQGACPTRAITFGNLADPHSEVSKAKDTGRHYTLLEELNTRPRTTYLAALKPSADEGKA